MLSFFKRNLKKESLDKVSILHWGMLSGVGQAVYIGLVIIFMNTTRVLAGEPLGGFVGQFLFFLLFFSLSAAVTAMFVFGRPLYLLLNKKYKEAVTVLLVTILTLLVILLLVFLVALII